jgi:hypothetical protein
MVRGYERGRISMTTVRNARISGCALKPKQASPCIGSHVSPRIAVSSYRRITVSIPKDLPRTTSIRQQQQIQPQLGYID